MAISTASTSLRTKFEKLAVNDHFQVFTAARKGIKTSTFYTFAGSIKMSEKKLAFILNISPRTISNYKENPPNFVLQEDDILFFDFGPIIGEWEADLGRTYVIGKDLKKWKLKEDVEKTWYETRSWVLSQKSLRASDLFEFVVKKAREKNWEFGGEIAGHLIGEFPHEKLEPENYELYVHPENHSDIFLPDVQGKTRHWILEIHFVDYKSKIGGFFEQLLM